MPSRGCRMKCFTLCQIEMCYPSIGAGPLIMERMMTAASTALLPDSSAALAGAKRQTRHLMLRTKQLADQRAAGGVVFNATKPQAPSAWGSKGGDVMTKSFSAAAVA